MPEITWPIKGQPLFIMASKWYFFDEIYADKFGPYPNYWIAKIQLMKYCRIVLGNY